VTRKRLHFDPGDKFVLYNDGVLANKRITKYGGLTSGG